MIPHEPESTVISYLHQAIREEKPGLIPNCFTIAAGSLEHPSFNYITVAKHHVYLDGDRGSLPVRDASYEVARSIVEDYIGAQMCVTEGCQPGLCWFPGHLTPRDIEENVGLSLALAVTKQAHQTWMLKMTQIADDDFSRYQKHNVVSDFQRKIAEIMHLNAEQHPWMNVSNSLKSDICPKCHSMYRPGMVICNNCSYILDKANYNAEDFAVRK